MNHRDRSRRIVLLLLAGALCALIAACQAVSPAAPVPTQPAAQPTSAPEQPAELQIIQDLSGVAQSLVVEVVPASPRADDSPWWAGSPELRMITLEGYPVTTNPRPAQVIIYPAAEIGKANPNAGGMVDGLRELLKSRQPGQELPFLPLVNAQQALVAQAAFIDFQNGSGVRYLSQYNQAPVPVNNTGLFYTFQGLTDDGQYYVAVILPVTHPDLPTTEPQIAEKQSEVVQKFTSYLNLTTTWLNDQPPAIFQPSLDNLDSLVQSIKVP